MDLPAFLMDSQLPVYTADMDGENVYDANLPKKAILVMGNEANGISKEIKAIIKNQLNLKFINFTLRFRENTIFYLHDLKKWQSF